MKIIHHGLKGSKPTKGYANGGTVRYSDNIEDRRATRPPWNKRALDAIDGPDEGDDPVLTAKDFRRATMPEAGQNGRTPSNNAIDDNFTRTQPYTGKGPQNFRENDIKEWVQKDISRTGDSDPVGSATTPNSKRRR